MWQSNISNRNKFMPKVSFKFMKNKEQEKVLYILSVADFILLTNKKLLYMIVLLIFIINNSISFLI